MKKLILSLLGIAAISSIGFAGTETYGGKEMKQVAVPPPCPEWYADREFNVSLWGTYIFTGNNWQDDRYLEADHAWGGGIDLKYFFMRYIGVGIEGWAVDARQARQDVFVDFSDGIFASSVHHESNAIGAMFGGGQRPINRFVREGFINQGGEGFDIFQTVGQTDSQTQAIGQVGGGLEIRLTPHIGWVSDFSWNFVDGPKNNFGMARTGVNFAF